MLSKNVLVEILVKLLFFYRYIATRGAGVGHLQGLAWGSYPLLLE